jgi:SPP1 gp7 family putative phage head morphogenesis protein
MPMLSTGRGVIFLEGSSLVGPPGDMIAPMQPTPVPIPGQPAPAAGAPGGSSPPSGGPEQTAAPGAPAPAQATPAAKAAEVAAWRRRTAKGARGRPFRWEHHDPAEVEALVKAGGPDPKAPWPGWSRDLQVAQHYEPALTGALTGAVGAQTLATRWTEHGGTADAAVARAWLGYDLAPRIAAALVVPLHRVWTEGWLIGDVSAGFMLRQLEPRPDITKMSVITKKSDTLEEFNHETDWGAWKPGDARAAAAILQGSGRYRGLVAMLDSGDATIRSIAEHRVDELARVLSQAAGEGWGNQKTAAAIRDLLTDQRWARMVAITEVSRASSASSLSRYAANGVDAKSWMTASDQRVCPECEENGQQGDIPLASYFQDGTDAPPGHPVCRCSVAPGWLPASSASGSGGLGLGDLVGLSSEEAGLGMEEIGADLAAADEWDAEVEDILSEVEAGVTEGPNLGGSTGANVHRVETDAGRVLVSKTPKDPYAGADEAENAAHQRDAEVLGAQVARAVGLDAPIVAQRDGELLMTFMRGDLAWDLPDESALLNGPQGDLMRLTDILISNNDRNLGNFMINGDRLGLFDHGLAFMPWERPEWAPPFGERKLAGWALRDGSWVDNKLTVSDVQRLKAALARLEPAFNARDRQLWYEDMMARLDVIGQHAHGTVDLL